MLDRTGHYQALSRLQPLKSTTDVAELRAHIDHLRSQIAGESRRAQQAETAHRDAVVRTDRAEHAERQVAAERDRWKSLALAHEAELKSLRREVNLP